MHPKWHRGRWTGADEVQLARPKVFPEPSPLITVCPTAVWMFVLTVCADAIGLVTTQARPVTATAASMCNERRLTVAPPARLPMRREACPSQKSKIWKVLIAPPKLMTFGGGGYGLVTRRNVTIGDMLSG